MSCFNLNLEKVLAVAANVESNKVFKIVAIVSFFLSCIAEKLEIHLIFLSETFSVTFPRFTSVHVLSPSVWFGHQGVENLRRINGTQLICQKSPL